MAGIVVQNANAYEDGLSDLARGLIAAEGPERVRTVLTEAVTRGQYEGGADPELVAPDDWTLDQHYLDLPGRDAAQIALALDYRTNVEAYPRWQRWLAEHRPPALIAVIGARGSLGGAVAREAALRGHEVTALGRADADVRDPAAIAKVVTGHDAVVASVKGPDRLVPRAAAALLEALPAAGVGRLVFGGGGGSLESPQGGRFVDSPHFPAQYRETALDQAAALDALRAADTPVEWSYASPPPVHLVPGERTGAYRAAAQDTPITDAAGESRITAGDFASAIVDALEDGSFVRQRFTAAS